MRSSCDSGTARERGQVLEAVDCTAMTGWLCDGSSAGQVVAMRVVLYDMYGRRVAVWRWHGRSAAVVSVNVVWASGLVSSYVAPQ